MNKREVRKSIQDGFSELSPDLCASILEAAEKENLIQWNLKPEQAEGSAESQDLKIVTISQKASEKRKKDLWHFSKYALSVCACFALVCICMIGLLRKEQNEICLLLNVNPSVKIVMDESCLVTDVQGLNEDGAAVAGELKWRRKGSVFEILDLLLENTANASYLNEDSGILVTICVSNPQIYEELENKIGVRIDRKLDEMKISGAIAAFQQGKEEMTEDGREYLETELAEQNEADLAQIRQMSVAELIRYCTEHTSVNLTLSPHSNQKWKEASEQKEEIQDRKNKIENEIIQETEEADVNSEEEEMQMIQTEETEAAYEIAEVENNPATENTKEDGSVTASDIQNAPASSEAPESNSFSGEENQNQPAGNDEDNKDDGGQKKKKKKDKKKKDQTGKKKKKKKDQTSKKKKGKKKKKDQTGQNKKENKKRKEQISQKKENKKKKEQISQKKEENKKKKEQSSQKKEENKKKKD